MILSKKEKKILIELYEDVDMNKLYFKYEGSTKDLNFNEYYDSKQLLMKQKIKVFNVMMQ